MIISDKTGERKNCCCCKSLFFLKSLVMELNGKIDKLSTRDISQPENIMDGFILAECQIVFPIKETIVLNELDDFLKDLEKYTLLVSVILFLP